jgi:lysozyme
MIPTEVLSVLLPLVKTSEGCRLQSYQDGAGVWTIGYGHTGLSIGPNVVWDQEQADTQLAVDLAQAYSQLLQASPQLSQETPGRQAALTDFVYYLGIHTYDRSTLHSAVTVGAWKSVAYQLSLWTHAGGKVEQGLVKRRKAEIALL